jgi:ribonuclease HII
LQAELVQLNTEHYHAQKEVKALRDDKTLSLRRNAELADQLKGSQEEVYKLLESQEQLKERMSAVRNLNKQLEQKANSNYVLLRRNEIYREVEDRMLAAEARVGELEAALREYLVEFETMSG